MATSGLRRMMAALVVLAAFGLVAVASIYTPLGVLDITIIPGSGGSGSTSGVLSQPAKLSLGNITAGSSGAYESTAVLSLDMPHKVKIEIENKEILRKIFSKFDVYVAINGEIYKLSLYGKYETHVYLDAGSYNVSVKVDYTVKPDAEGEYKDLIFLKAEIEDDSSHSSTTYTTTSGDYDHED